mmetsp:Transcript_22294/g.51305  ORF Transcript_22294/g.51305 Transcript_22294/m.51305 type:complete len:352 (-) Transcript_22294:1272-2327(-)
MTWADLPRARYASSCPSHVPENENQMTAFGDPDHAHIVLTSSHFKDTSEEASALRDSTPRARCRRHHGSLHHHQRSARFQSGPGKKGMSGSHPLRPPPRPRPRPPRSGGRPGTPPMPESPSGSTSGEMGSNLAPGGTEPAGRKPSGPAGNNPLGKGALGRPGRGTSNGRRSCSPPMMPDGIPPSGSPGKDPNPGDGANGYWPSNIGGKRGGSCACACLARSRCCSACRSASYLSRKARCGLAVAVNASGSSKLDSYSARHSGSSEARLAKALQQRVVRHSERASSHPSTASLSSPTRSASSIELPAADGSRICARSCASNGCTSLELSRWQSGSWPGSSFGKALLCMAPCV